MGEVAPKATKGALAQVALTVTCCYPRRWLV